MSLKIVGGLPRRSKTQIEGLDKRKLSGVKLMDHKINVHKINVIEYLTDTIGVSRPVLAALLQVTERYLEACRDKTREQLRKTPKTKRLVDLYDFVVLARKSGIKDSQVLGLLMHPFYETPYAHPTEGETWEAPSILHYILQNPDVILLDKSWPQEFKAGRSKA